VWVSLQHPAQQFQLLADSVDPHFEAFRIAVKVRAVFGHAHQLLSASIASIVPKRNYLAVDVTVSLLHAVGMDNSFRRF
jgi:hypothetical protein